MAEAASALRPEDAAAAAARCRPPGAGSGGCPPQRSPGATGSGEGAGRAMERAGPGRAGGARRGRGQRRPPTWEISDSDAEGSAGAETPARARESAGERRPVAEALQRLRPGQAVRRLAVLVDPAVLEDAGADTLMEALHALGCEPRAEPQRPARSLRWSRASPDPCPRGVPPEVWAEDEPHVLLLLEPEEFVQGVVQLTQVCGPTCSIPWVTPESPVCLHLVVIGLDAYLWSQQPSTQETWQPERPAVTRAEAAVGWPEVEEALVRLQLWANVDVLLVASWQELSQHVCAFTKALTQLPFKPGSLGPSPSAPLGAGRQASEWPEMARGYGGSGGGRSGSSTVSAWLWPMLLSAPSHPPACCSRRTLPVARSRSAWPCWPTSR
ncbi:probable crossover junction endonuclease EME2 isoform X3 [Moschus berezovskii]|uniref:probable crossover junction endonuclease EME2 isoform X3 n=1 Tax=Moschus berezovskii TaxID=68408 RepID=UPI002443F265|nr:probable crossover junction endonuclease EME2 isoform X3 [Moschus berezovskii]